MTGIQCTLLMLTVFLSACVCLVSSHILEDEIEELQRKVTFYSDDDSSDGKRPGCPTNTHRCDNITEVPPELTFITKYNYYRKYTHAYGIPVISSGAVHDAALKRACYVVRVLLADNPVIRYYFYKNYGRAGIMGYKEVTTDIPEHSHLSPWWNQRARGLGGALSTGAEENLLCWIGDSYGGEDIFLHEFAHGVYMAGIAGGALPNFHPRFVAAYENAKAKGLWNNTYAIKNYGEYFAEGVQSYFDVNSFAKNPNGIHNSINTREKLKVYDPTMYALLKEIFPCQNNLTDRCDFSEPYHPITMDCNDSGRGRKEVLPPKKQRLPQPKIVYPDCKDRNNRCSYWASVNECKKNPGYMK